jgi:DNA-directed RNA polymerase subunit L
MEINIAEKTKDSITVRIRDPNMTLITPILKKLSDDNNVSLMRYVEKHPELEDSAIIIKTVKGDPEEALKKAVASIAEYFSGIKTN